MVARFTILVIFSLFFLYFLPFKLFLELPVEKVLEDFDYSDLAFANKNTSDIENDSTIIVVNVGNGKRGTIDSVLRMVGKLAPKAIGLDLLFLDSVQRQPSDSFNVDSSLASTIHSLPNLVIAVKIETETRERQGIFNGCAHHLGFANFNALQGNTIREFSPFYKSDTSFALQLMQIYDSVKFRKIVSRQKDEEIINYRRDAKKYNIIESDSLLSGSRSSFTNKIVLIGFYSTNRYDIEDKHVTPLNKVVFGKSLPDCYGVIINANILSMMIEESYIDKLGVSSLRILTCLLIWMCIFLFEKYRKKFEYFHHPLVTLTVFFFIVVLVMLSVVFLSFFQFKLDLAFITISLPIASELYIIYLSIYEFKKHRANTKENKKH